MNFIMRSIWLVLLVSLSGCDQKPEDYAYYMSHPKVLEKRATQCQSHSSGPDAQGCSVILKAAQDFAQMVYEQQSDPEAFGRKIMTDQIMAEQTRQAMNAAETAYKKLKTSHAKATALEAAHEKYAEYRDAYLAEQNQIHAKLAAVSILSPS